VCFVVAFVHSSPKPQPQAWNALGSDRMKFQSSAVALPWKRIWWGWGMGTTGSTAVPNAALVTNSAGRVQGALSMLMESAVTLSAS
jgi:hypothetical protein